MGFPFMCLEDSAVLPKPGWRRKSRLKTQHDELATNSTSCVENHVNDAGVDCLRETRESGTFSGRNDRLAVKDEGWDESPLIWSVCTGVGCAEALIFENVRDEAAGFMSSLSFRSA